VLTDYSDVEAEVTLGFITHAVNVNETGLDGYRLVFEKLSNAGIQLASLAEVTERYTYTSVAAGAAALEHRCGADEAGD
jgi:hypothetical protein